MAVSKSSLSAGEIIRQILIDDPEVSSRTKKVFPVVTDTAELPYIVYRRTQLEQTPVKGVHGAEVVSVEVVCYTQHYTEGVELAEAVRDALDGVQATTDDGLTMRSCRLVDSEEGWQDDAFLQQLIFNIKI